MTRYYVEWELRTGGEFYVEADTPLEVNRIAQAVVENELAREIFDAANADITIGEDDDDEPVAPYPPTFRVTDSGDIEQVDS